MKAFKNTWIIILLIFVYTFFLFAKESDVMDQYSNILPNHGFIQNKGQWSKDVLFAHQGKNQNIIVSKEKIVFDFYERNHQDSSKTGSILSLTINNMSELSEIIPLDAFDYHYNYFLFDNPDNWAIDVKIFKNIKISNIYNNIDMLLSFQNNKVRYDIIVNPGADPSDISFTYKGQDSIRINEKGNIELFTGNKIIENNSLYAYQVINGLEKQVDCEFNISYNEISFSLGDYDKSIELVIDPIVLSSYFGGSDFDSFKSIKMDENGDYFIIGTTNSPDFYITPGAYKKDKDFYNVAVISKIKISGDSTMLLYSTYFGGSGGDGASDIIIDDNTIYFTGQTNSFDFPKVKSINYELSGGSDCFVVKMNDSLNNIEYSTIFGGNLDDIPKSLDVQSGEVYLTGQTRSTNFPTTSSCFQNRNAGITDVFVCKLSYTGNSLLYSSYIGGSGDDMPYKIHVNNGSAVIGGVTTSSTIENVKFGYDLTGNGTWDGFIAKINNTGHTLEYFSFLGGTNADFLWDFDIDPTNGDIIFIGDVEYDQNMKNFPKTELGDSTFKGKFDCFMGKLSSSGSELKLMTILGGSEDDNINSLVFEPISRNIYLTGSTQSINFPVTDDFMFKLDNSFDPYICIFESDSFNLQTSTIILSPFRDTFSGNMILQDHSYPIILTNTSKDYYPIYGKPIQKSLAGDIDAYFFKYVFGQIKIDLGFNSLCTGDEINISWSISNNLEKNDQLIQIKQVSDDHWINIGSRSGGNSLKVIIPEYIKSGDEYKIRITHPSGLHSNEFGYFSVNSSPKILEFTTNTGETAICESEFFQLIAETNEDDLDYKWYHNGIEISDNNQPVFEFNSIKPEDSGAYYLIASNNCKPDVTSETLNITVFDQTEILEGPNDTTVAEGTKAILWINTIGNDLKYQWYKNDQVLLGAFDPILEIKNIKESDEAYYHCIIEGTCGSETSEKALIKVDGSSSVQMETSSVNININVLENIVSDQLFFTASTYNSMNCTIEILDLNGDISKRIFSGLISTNKSFIVNVKDLISGTYWISIRSGNSTKTEKFIIIK